jgi:hypothetical protein
MLLGLSERRIVLAATHQTPALTAAA